MASPHEDPALQSLLDMFGSTLNPDVIETVLRNCGGDISQTVDAMLKISLTDDNVPTSKPQKADQPSISPSSLSNVASSQEQSTSHSSNHREIRHYDTPQLSNVTQDIRTEWSSTKQSLSPYAKSFAVVANQEPSFPSTNARESRNPTRGNKIVKLTNQLQKIIEYHKSGYRTLIVLRGCPGSGKSTLARQIVDMTVGASPLNYKSYIFSADDYFSRNGNYVYDVTRLSEAHEWNKSTVLKALSLGQSPVIVDNTHCLGWEMEPYICGGVEHGYFIEIVEPNTPWAKKASQLVKKNTHNVPYGKIVKMLDKYEEFHNSDNILKTMRLSYSPPNVPPVMRNTPPVPLSAVPSRTYPGTPTAASSHQLVDSEHAAQSASTSSQSDNRSINQQIKDLQSNHLFQTSLEEFEKLSREWESGVQWVESESRQNNDSPPCTDVHPKPQREHSRTRSASRPRHNVGETDNSQSEWQQISSSVPAWDHDAVRNFESPQQSTHVVKTSSGTSVESADHQVNYSNFRVISARARDINFSYVPPLIKKIPHTVMLDKSSTTAEEFDPEMYRCKNADKHFIQLRKMFKSVPEADLRDIFEKCGGNVNWASELLLDGIPDAILAIEEGNSSGDDENRSGELCDCVAAYNIVPRTVEKPISVEVTPLEMPNVKKKKGKFVSESSNNLRIQIEQGVDIADHHYSNHSLKIKKLRHGSHPYDVGSSIYEQQPSSSTGPSTNMDCGETSKSESKYETSNIPTESLDDPQDVICIESSSTSDGGDSSDYPEETLNVTLGMELIKQAIKTFENRDVVYPSIIAPVVNMPKSLLNQIYALWLESLAHQVDSQSSYTEVLMKEDEDFARQLAEKEAEMERAGEEPEVPDLSEIMDMELALSLARRDVEEWRNSEPNDMAARLTRDKLHNLFPDIDRSVLSELLVAHDNSFQQTIEGLLVSTGQANILEEKNGINKFVMKREMDRQQEILEQARQQALQEEEWPVLGGQNQMEMETVNEYREEARKHLRHRNTNHEKAQYYFNNGKTDAAAYHSQLANYHKLQCEQYNSRAANALIQVHATNKSNNTLDLHFLYVAEALQTLDLFLDYHIQQLTLPSGSQNNSLFLITGRGLHSPKGPRIKPAVKQRLQQRGLTHSEVNPGLLVVGITTANRLTHQVG